MSTIISIAFRNLFRQKRRNLLLGTAIAIGTLVLVLANSFSHGMSKTLIERVVVYVAGHANVGFSHKGKMMAQVMRGGAHWREKIEKIPSVSKVDPTMGVMARAIGNGRSDNVFLVAINMQQEFSHEDSILTADNFSMVEGDWGSLQDSTIENPLIISVAKAKYLNVGMGDVVRVRLQDFDGRFQAVRLTIVGIFRPSNMFMDGALFMELGDMSQIMGLRPEDSPYLYLTIDRPEDNAVLVADSIWKLMAPPLAQIHGTVAKHQAVLLGFRSDSISLSKLRTNLGMLQGDSNLAYTRKAAMLAKPLAESLKVHPGDTITLQYPLRFKSPGLDSFAKMRIPVAATFTPPDSVSHNWILFHETRFQDQFLDALPAQGASTLSFDSTQSWSKLLSLEWERLPRSRTTDDVAKHRREISQGKYKGTAVTIDTMYESASSILQLESALQMITLGAVLVIFLVILIGVVNTLRMTVKERTREIGTLRAIGMQRGDIRLMFLLETALLAFFASLAGTLLAFLTMTGLSQIPIASEGNPLGVILVRGHLYFAPTLLSCVLFVLMIVGIAIVTAWFPASRAAKLPPATAMRHYD